MSFQSVLLSGKGPSGSTNQINLSYTRIRRAMNTRIGTLPRPNAFGDLVQLFNSEQSEIDLEGTLSSRNTSESFPPISNANNVIPIVMFWQQNNVLITYGESVPDSNDLGGLTGTLIHTTNCYVVESSFVSNLGVYFPDEVLYRIKLMQLEGLNFGVT